MYSNGCFSCCGMCLSMSGKGRTFEFDCVHSNLRLCEQRQQVTNLWFTSDELLGAFSGSTGFTEINFSLPRLRWNDKQKVPKLSRWHQKLRSEPTIIEFVWDLFLMSRKLLLCVSGLEDEVKLQPHLLFCLHLHLHLCCWSRTLWLLCIVVVLQRCKKCFSAANFHCQWHKIESRPA